MPKTTKKAKQRKRPPKATSKQATPPAEDCGVRHVSDKAPEILPAAELRARVAGVIDDVLSRLREGEELAQMLCDAVARRTETEQIGREKELGTWLLDLATYCEQARQAYERHVRDLLYARKPVEWSEVEAMLLAPLEGVFPSDIEFTGEAILSFVRRHRDACGRACAWVDPGRGDAELDRPDRMDNPARRKQRAAYRHAVDTTLAVHRETDPRGSDPWAEIHLSYLVDDLSPSSTRRMDDERRAHHAQAAMTGLLAAETRYPGLIGEPTHSAG